MTAQRQCRVCGNTRGNVDYAVREMMYGWRETFQYFECANCGCLQIAEIPDNLARYYPHDYYSFVAPSCKVTLLQKVKRVLKQHRLRYLYDKRDFLGLVVASLCGRRGIPPWLRTSIVRPESEILEVGCGYGQLLLYLKDLGFSNLTGIDPFIDTDIDHGNGVRILKKDLSGMERQFDFIMMHASFEHMPNPHDVFRDLQRIMRPDSQLLVCTPVMGTFAWRTYGCNWVQLDAPRHLFIPTVKSMQILTQDVGMEVYEIEFDSTKFQFWGSEQYLMDIPLEDKRSYGVNPANSIFSSDETCAFIEKACDLNRKGEGDQARFYIRKSRSTTSL